MLIATRTLLFVGVVHATCTLSSLYPNIQSCVDLPLQYSCENTTAFTNPCCNVVKGGLVLQTQFWDTYTGLERFGQMLPQGSWGIHGLWLDNCDGRVSISYIILDFLTARTSFYDEYSI
jgi:ribonuclease T2